MNQRQIEKERERLQRQEQKFVDKNTKTESKEWQKKIEKYVPDKLEHTLNTAFFKAFELIFEKGTGVIEKTYNKEKKEQNYKINEFAAEIKNNKKSVKAFEKQAKGSRNLNMAFSAAEGIGMGIFGMGIPDIPVFLSLLLKSIYEIALSYGFSYDTEEEQIYILKIIETALAKGEALAKGNAELNRWSRGEVQWDDRTEQMQKTSDALAKEMLYLKFVQGIPVVGIAGGLSDIVYQKKITDYAALKYKRRFLECNYASKNPLISSTKSSASRP